MRNEGEATILASQVKSGCASGVSADYRNALLLFKDLLKHSNSTLYGSPGCPTLEGEGVNRVANRFLS